MTTKVASNRISVKSHAMRDTGKQLARARRNAQEAPVEVRFVCPVCGGPHSRAGHV